MDDSRDSEKDFAEEYAQMSDKELLGLAAEYGDLIASAQAAMRAELSKRGREIPEPQPEPKPEPPKFPGPSVYATMSNRKLLRVAEDYDHLPETNKTALREEFTARGLEPPVIEDETEPEAPLDEGEEPNLVTVQAYRDLPPAFVARAILQEAGIPCFLRDEYTIGMDWGISNMIGGAKLQVPVAYLEAAKERLSEPIPPSFEDNEGNEFVQPVCPKCGSLDVDTNDADRKIKLASTLAAGVPMIVGLPALAFVRKGVWKCMNCGCKWYDDGQAGP